MKKTSLAQYQAKRHFQDTPEPPAHLSATTDQRFCVQRHHASRLHYDFRLEAEGVLKSWAVPKGPSLDPADRHAAAHVEDHPVDYLTFEGVIPEGNYGAGSVMLWDLGTYDLAGPGDFAAQFEAGHIRFTLHGSKLKGRFSLVRMNSGQGKQWLLFKKRDEAAVPGWDIEDSPRSVSSHLSQAEIARGVTGATWTSHRHAASVPGRKQARPPARRRKKALALPESAQVADMPPSLRPMRATVGKPFSDPDWVFEVQREGVRALAYGQDASVQVFSERGHPIVRQFPELEALALNVDASSFILDGDIVALLPDGRSDFERLQPRLRSTAAQALNLSRRLPVTYYASDLVYLNGHDLRAVPYVERRKLLRAVVKPDALVRLSDEIEEHGEALLDLARERGLSGVVGKRRQSTYQDGQASADWVSLPTEPTTEVVVAGFMRPPKERTTLLLGLYRGGHLRPVGTAQVEAPAGLMELLEPLKTKDTPYDEWTGPATIQWVQPQLVVLVAHHGWTRDKRLRKAVYRHARPDREPTECVLPGRQPAHSATPHRPLLGPDLVKQVVSIDGVRLTLTNLNKVMYPQDGLTKRDILNFYYRIGPMLVPYLKNRPLSLKRYPNGIEAPFFFQRHADDKLPSWLPTAHYTSSAGKEEETFLIQNQASLLYLVNLGCLDQNMWMSRIGTLDHPDFLLLDLDPVECTVSVLVQAAQALHAILDAIGLLGYPKTTGGRGLHIWVPLELRYTFEQTRMLAQAIAQIARTRHPHLFTLPRLVEKRDKGKVYLDFPHNRRGNTIAAPYVVRAFPGATVATPLAWNELKKGFDPKAFNTHTVFDRLERVGDLYRPVLDAPQALEGAIERLEDLP